MLPQAAEVRQRRMTKAELMEDVGNYVEIRLFDGTILKGKLGYTSEFCEAQGYRRPNYFFIGNYCFKASHVTKLIHHFVSV